MMFDINPDTENVVSAVYKTLSRSILPALLSCSGWGDINPPNPKSETYISYYKTKVMLFMDYLLSEFFIYNCTDDGRHHTYRHGIRKIINM